jgi:hypothetical protein
MDLCVLVFQGFVRYLCDGVFHWICFGIAWS